MRERRDASQKKSRFHLQGWQLNHLVEERLERVGENLVAFHGELETVVIEKLRQHVALARRLLEMRADIEKVHGLAVVGFGEQRVNDLVDGSASVGAAAW